MNKSEFIRQLRATAAAMKPLTVATSSNAATWDGQQYIQTTGRQPDPYALSWWSILNTIAALLEAQNSRINKEQRDYLDRTLFGGMGSLNDLYFDPKAVGSLADSVNNALDDCRRKLYASFREN